MPTRDKLLTPSQIYDIRARYEIRRAYGEPDEVVERLLEHIRAAGAAVPRDAEPLTDYQPA